MEEPDGISGAQAWAIQKVPLRFTSMTWRNDSGVSRDAGTAVPTPALLTSTSTRPSSCSATAATAWQSSGELTSAATVNDPGTRLAQGGGQVVEPVEATRGEHQVRPDGGERLRETHAQSRAGAGQDHDLVVEPERRKWIHLVSSSWR